MYSRTRSPPPGGKPHHRMVPNIYRASPRNLHKKKSKTKIYIYSGFFVFVLFYVSNAMFGSDDYAYQEKKMESKSNSGLGGNDSTNGSSMKMDSSSLAKRDGYPTVIDDRMKREEKEAPYERDTVTNLSNGDASENTRHEEMTTPIQEDQSNVPPKRQPWDIFNENQGTGDEYDYQDKNRASMDSIDKEEDRQSDSVYTDEHYRNGTLVRNDDKENEDGDSYDIHENDGKDASSVYNHDTLENHNADNENHNDEQDNDHVMVKNGTEFGDINVQMSDNETITQLQGTDEQGIAPNVTADNVGNSGGDANDENEEDSKSVTISSLGDHSNVNENVTDTNLNEADKQDMSVAHDKNMIVHDSSVEVHNSTSGLPTHEMPDNAAGVDMNENSGSDQPLAARNATTTLEHLSNHTLVNGEPAVLEHGQWNDTVVNDISLVSQKVDSNNETEIKSAGEIGNATNSANYGNSKTEVEMKTTGEKGNATSATKDSDENQTAFVTEADAKSKEEISNSTNTNTATESLKKPVENVTEAEIETIGEIRNTANMTTESPENQFDNHTETDFQTSGKLGNTTNVTTPSLENSLNNHTEADIKTTGEITNTKRTTNSTTDSHENQFDNHTEAWPIVNMTYTNDENQLDNHTEVNMKTTSQNGNTTTTTNDSPDNELEARTKGETTDGSIKYQLDNHTEAVIKTTGGTNTTRNTTNESIDNHLEPGILAGMTNGTIKNQLDDQTEAVVKRAGEIGHGTNVTMSENISNQLDERSEARSGQSSGDQDNTTNTTTKFSMDDKLGNRTEAKNDPLGGDEIKNAEVSSKQVMHQVMKNSTGAELDHKDNQWMSVNSTSDEANDNKAEQK